MLAVIIKTHPPASSGAAVNYYNSIQRFLERQGFTVEFVSGEPDRKFTYPTEATLFVAHGTGTELLKQLPSSRQEHCVILGHPDGVIDPLDLEWQEEYPDREEHSVRHFIFTQSQRQALQSQVALIMG